jgi:hypothetical protein
MANNNESYDIFFPNNRNIVPKAAYSSEFLRKNGSCPLTPEEVGLLLSGMGFRNTTPIYVAGKVFLACFDFMMWKFIALMMVGSAKR